MFWHALRAPIYPLTALVLLACGQPVVLQGGERMPIKYGVTAVDLFRLLDLNLTGLPISAVADGFPWNCSGHPTKATTSL